jgi:peptide/nickel transport system ATP-binding protein
MLIAGFLRPASGRIEILGSRLRWARDGTSSVAGDVQILFQDPISSINPRRRLNEWMVLGVPHSKERVDEALSDVGLSLNILERLPSEISGGECQRFQLAKILCSTGRIIILDECTSMLDPVSREIVTKVVLRRLFGKRTIIVFSHDQDFSEKISRSYVKIDELDNSVS